MNNQIKELANLLYKTDCATIHTYEERAKRLIAKGVAVVKHGEWKNNKNDYPECTNCGYMPMYDHSIDDIYYSPYCPECGAKMENGGAVE